jgi:hypothetical protein
MIRQPVKITDNRVRTRTDAQNAAWGLAFWVNWVQLIIYLYIVVSLFQETITRFTYYVNGTTSCLLNGTGFYDLGLQRWMYLAFTLNCFDLKFSLNYGEKFWGKYTFFMNGAALILNILIFTVTNVAWLPTCNQDGTGNASNPCTNRYFCGDAVLFANPDNNCAAKNPFGAVTPAITITFWNWDPAFIQWYALTAVYCGLQLLKTISNAYLPQSTEIIRKGTSYIQKKRDLDATIDTQPLKIFEGEDKTPVRERDVYTNLEFFDIYSRTQISAYWAIWIIDWLFGGFIVTWFGWFLQNTKLTPYWFKEVSTPSPHVAIVTKGWFELGVNYWVYFSVGIIIICWVLNGYMAHMFANKRATYAAFIGAVFSILFMIFIWIYYSIYCNQFGQGGNICNNRKRFCSTLTSGSVGYWTFTQNQCLNNYACPDVYLETDPKIWDDDYIALNWFVGFSIPIFLAVGIFTYLIQKTIDEDVANQRENIEVDKITVKQKIIENTVPTGYIPQTNPYINTQIMQPIPQQQQQPYDSYGYGYNYNYY